VVERVGIGRAEGFHGARSPRCSTASLRDTAPTGHHLEILVLCRDGSLAFFTSNV